MMAPTGTRLFEQKHLFADGWILQVRITLVPEPVLGSEHRFKYRLFYGRAGERTVLYDNERGKGDHRHYGDREENYPFDGVERLIHDFLEDVARARRMT